MGYEEGAAGGLRTAGEPLTALKSELNGEETGTTARATTGAGVFGR